MKDLPFVKMHGLGNDFVVLDARAQSLELTPAQVRAIADRRTGVGCDQLILVEAERDARADAYMRIRNADGGEVEACGNATRCVAAMRMAETGRDRAVIETTVGLLDAEAAGPDRVAVDMGPARLDWREIPLAAPADTLHLDVEAGPLGDGAAVNIGNPHVVFFVADAEAVDLERWGPVVEHDPQFPERTNVEVAEIISSTEVRMRVWERGVGITRACGSGACATLVAANRRGLIGRVADVRLDGGTLQIEWLENGHVRMTGPAAVSFHGTLNGGLLGRE